MDPDPAEVVETASQAAEAAVFSHVARSAVTDLDVTVSFEDGVLEVDVYLEVPDEDVDEEELADEAALVAGEAVDELLA